MKEIKNDPTIWKFIGFMIVIILLLCGITLLLSSCTELAIDHNEDKPGSGVATGKDGNLKFALSFDSYGEGEDISTRSAAGLETETVVVPLDNGLFMFATLEPATEEGVKTRSEASGLFADNTLLYIVAYKQNGATYIYEHHVGYRVKVASAAMTLEREGWDPFSLTVGGVYRFVAYSYNNATTVLPEISKTILKIEDIPPGLDLIWGASGDKTISSGSNYIEIPMSHLFSKVQLDALSNVGNITAISDVKMYGHTADLTVESGAMVSHTDSAMLFTGFSPLNSASVSSTRIVYTAETVPTIVNIGSITIGGTPYKDLTATFIKQLISGYAYHIKIRIGNSDDLTDDTPPAGFTPYVGAFWRHDQKGERLIRMTRPSSGSTAADGLWSATVVKGADWIMLDTNPSADGNVWKSAGPALSGIDGGFESTHYLSDGSVYVNGVMDASKQEIYFRIGLKNTLSNPADHRYGVVLLTYAGNTKRQRIFIRQGEAPDYLMQPTDAVSSGGMNSSTRPNAMMFAVYNLKDPYENDKVNRAEMTTPATGRIPAGGGVFTDYPTQAGYFFLFNATSLDQNPANAMYAFNPYSPPIASWAGMGNGPAYWDTATHETCPINYRRPTDGVTNAHIDVAVASANNSEMRQSLFLNPQSGTVANNDNAIVGYYADGFFDRRELASNTNSSNHGVNAAVSVGNSKIAYKGSLFFNSHTGASIFFPAAGYRQNATSFQSAGNIGYYRSSSSVSATSSWYLYTNAGNSSFYAGSGARNAGYSVRCVYDPCRIAAPIISANRNAITTDPAESPYNSTTLTIDNYNPAFSYQWQISVNDGVSWSNIGGATGATYTYTAAPPPTPPLVDIFHAVHFRVEATANGCSNSALSNEEELWITTPGTVPPDNYDDPEDIMMITYVGAFWKNNQRGERLIRIKRPTIDLRDGTPLGSGAQAFADGEWTARVIVGMNWINLDQTPSPGGTPYGNDTGFETSSRFVEGDVKMVHGTMNAGNPEMYFRIGLTGTNPLSTPRYGVVLVTYKNNTLAHRIWIRQGEEPDYIYSGANTVKWSPYNVTDSRGGTRTTWNDGDVPQQNRVFVEYPTMGGYMFAFGQNLASYSPFPAGGGSGWGYTAGISPLGSSQDICQNLANTIANATVYFRPSALNYQQSFDMWGVLNDPVHPNNTRYSRYSEIGYYADGYFDRQPIGDAVTGDRPLTVVNTGANTAYIGRVIVNTDTNASVFFPYVGSRTFNGGTLRNVGYYGDYWTSNTTGNTTDIHANDTGDAPDYYAPVFQPSWAGSGLWYSFGQSGAASLRCVRP